MYSIKNEYLAGQIVGQVFIRNDGNTITSFGKNLDNTDYANFKKDLADGAELFDAEGNVIDGIAYLATLES
jgi:hypothetical protein